MKVWSVLNGFMGEIMTDLILQQQSSFCSSESWHRLFRHSISSGPDTPGILLQSYLWYSFLTCQCIHTQFPGRALFPYCATSLW